MRRRDFIALGSAAAVAGPTVASAQQSQIPVVGFLRVTSAADATNLVNAFRQGLVDAGFVEGRNIAIEYRWADGHGDRLPRLAADLINRQVAAIVGHSTAVMAAKAATTTIPIVGVVGDDPVRTGMVTNLNRPGGNVTGVSFGTIDVSGKRLGLCESWFLKAMFWLRCSIQISWSSTKNYEPWKPPQKSWVAALWWLELPPHRNWMRHSSPLSNLARAHCTWEAVHFSLLSDNA